MPLQKEQIEHLKMLTVNLLLSLRKEYLITGANPLKHWEQLQSRAKLAAKLSTTVDEWYSNISRRLSLASPSNSLSSDLAQLREYAESVESEWVSLVEDQIPALIARCRVIAEAQQLAKKHKIDGWISKDEIYEEIDLKQSEKKRKK